MQVNKVIVLSALLLITNRIFAQDTAIDRKVDRLISQMTLEEKLGQMTQFHVSDIPLTESAIRKGEVGSLLNVHSTDQVIRFQNIATKESRLKIPLIIGRDVIHGYRTILPIPLAQAATWNTDLVKKGAEIEIIKYAA